MNVKFSQVIQLWHIEEWIRESLRYQLFGEVLKSYQTPIDYARGRRRVDTEFLPYPMAYRELHWDQSNAFSVIPCRLSEGGPERFRPRGRNCFGPLRRRGHGLLNRNSNRMCGALNLQQKSLSSCFPPHGRWQDDVIVIALWLTLV